MRTEVRHIFIRVNYHGLKAVACDYDDIVSLLAG